MYDDKFYLNYSFFCVSDCIERLQFIFEHSSPHSYKTRKSPDVNLWSFRILYKAARNGNVGIKEFYISKKNIRLLIQSSHTLDHPVL